MISYTHYLAEIDEGRSPNVPAPAIAKRYWGLADDATLRDVVLVVRADEAHHRDVNHGFANELGRPARAARSRPVRRTRSCSRRGSRLPDEQGEGRAQSIAVPARGFTAPQWLMPASSPCREIDEERAAAIGRPLLRARPRRPLIGPVFNDAIADWPEHLEKLQAFWSSVMLTSGRYKGRPLPAHIRHGEASRARRSIAGWRCGARRPRKCCRRPPPPRFRKKPRASPRACRWASNSPRAAGFPLAPLRPPRHRIRPCDRDLRSGRPSMDVRDNVLEAIGGTPLIRLTRASEETGCEILGKAEFMNPGQSVKDRAALFIIRDAIDRGTLRPGGRGRRRHRRQYRHRPRRRRQRARPAHRHRHSRDAEPGEEGHAAAARRRADRGAGGALRQPQQLCEGVRPDRRAAGRIRARTARSGPTSSTMSPIARPMSAPPVPKSGSRPAARSTASSARSAPAAPWPASPRRCAARKPDVAIAIADPFGAALYSCYTTGVLQSSGNSISEGIGQGRITANLEGLAVDAAFQIPDEEGVRIVFDLLEHEGLCLGLSSGINVAGAIRLARAAGPRPHHRHHPRRLWHALPVAAVQSGFPARKRGCRCPAGSSGRGRRSPISSEADRAVIGRPEPLLLGCDSQAVEGDTTI